MLGCHRREYIYRNLSITLNPNSDYLKVVGFSSVDFSVSALDILPAAFPFIRNSHAQKAPKNVAQVVDDKNWQCRSVPKFLLNLSFLAF